MPGSHNLCDSVSKVHDTQEVALHRVKGQYSAPVRDKTEQVARPNSLCPKVAIGICIIHKDKARVCGVSSLVLSLPPTIWDSGTSRAKYVLYGFNNTDWIFLWTSLLLPKPLLTLRTNYISNGKKFHSSITPSLGLPSSCTGKDHEQSLSTHPFLDAHDFIASFMCLPSHLCSILCYTLIPHGENIVALWAPLPSFDP